MQIEKKPPTEADCVKLLTSQCQDLQMLCSSHRENTGLHGEKINNTAWYNKTETIITK